MIIANHLFLWFISLTRLIVAVNVNSINENDTEDFLQSLNEKSAKIATKLVRAQWEFETNNTENAKNELYEITSETIENAKLRFRNIINNYPWNYFPNPDIRRQLKLFSEIGTLVLPLEQYQQFQQIISHLSAVQKKTICDFYNKTKCDLRYNPDIKEKLETSQNSGELSYLWTEWRKETEPELRHLLSDYVKLCNQAAVLHNYTNFQEYSLRNIDLKDIKEEITSLWKEIQPLYQQMHAFVRKKLRDVYGEEMVPRKGLIPAFLLGNIWSENWSGIAHRIVPFQEKNNINFTAVMIKQGYTPTLIHQLAEDFFESLNFTIPKNLWYNHSEDEASNNKMGTCHPKIFNFYDHNISIKDCGKVTLNDYLTANRLLAKAEYMLEYSYQPYVFQNPADPGLEEALNNVIAMSTSTFKFMKKIGLYNNEINNEVRLNRLFKMAMEKVASIPFLLVQELWRWEVYNGKPVEDTKATLNKMREKFQGISTYTNELSFDPGGIGSVFSKLSLVHRFLGSFFEFQIYESLCQMSDDISKENETFDECSLYKNIKAGDALRKIMSLGSSKPLMETLSPVLGQNKISSKSLMKYFEPLMKWLKKENEKTGEFIGWEESKSYKKTNSKKIRRKRSLDDYSSESKDDDTVKTSSREPDRFQRLVYKRSKDTIDNPETNERNRKSTGNEQESNEKKSIKEKNSLAEDKKERRSAEKTGRRYSYSKNRRSLMKSNKNMKENAKEMTTDEEKGNDNSQKSNKLTSRSRKRHTGSESYGQNYDSSKFYDKNFNYKEDMAVYKKRSDDYGTNKNYENTGNGNNVNHNNVGSGNNNNKMRYIRWTKKKQRRFDNEVTDAQNHKIWRRKDKNLQQRDRMSRNAQWHTDTKKDISRLLHSFGFAVENDDKEKIKELKKKLKGDSNSDLKSNIASKENTYESIVDYSRMKSGDGRTETGEEKGTNKLWSVKSYMTDNAKVLQSTSSLDKKDSVSNSRLTSSMLTHGSEEKSVGKKETSPNSEPNVTPSKDRTSELAESHPQSSDSAIRHLNIDVPSLQALLKNADLNSYGQKPVYAITPESSDSKSRSDLNQVLNVKSTPNKYGSYMYKYTPNGEMLQYKDKKEFRDDTDSGSKSPYIIILGQVSPEMKERLTQEKGSIISDADKQSQLQSGSNTEEKKMSDKRGRASDQIYILPIDLKNTQHNLLKPNHYAEHEHEAGHDPNTERDQESEEEQLHLEDNSKLEDKSNFYRTGKENPSEFIISWNNDKNRKIVKRSKREHKKDLGDEKLKVVRIAPMKESILEGLLGKSFDRANLDDKNVKILIHDGLLNGGSDLSSALAAASSPMGSSAMDQSQTASLQPSSSSLSSLASSVLSALSPKNYFQVAKAVSQHQDSDLEEDNLKESSGPQAIGPKEQKEQELPFLVNPGLRCNALVGKKKGAKLYSDEDAKKLLDEAAAKGDDACCKKIILTPCPPKSSSNSCPCPCPLPGPMPTNSCPCPTPCPCPSPSPEPDNGKRIIECPPMCSKADNQDLCCKKPSECSLVNCQFKITKAKKPHERLTIMIYDRINPPAELPEPYDALAVISEILQRIQCCSNKQGCQLTEEDPDYPANDNSDQLKGNPNQPQDNKGKIQELSGEIPILGNDNPEEDESDDNPQNVQNSPNSAEEDKFQPKEKATPAIDQLTVFNKDKLKPVFIELRKIDDIIKKRSQQE